MKKINAIAALLISILLTACNQKPKSQELHAAQSKDSVQTEIPQQTNPASVGKPIIAPATFINDFTSFWNYYSTEIKLNADFLAYDNKGDSISKAAFLSSLSTGLYYPLLVYGKKTAELNYKLEKIPAKASPYIAAYMKDFSKQELVFYKMKGKDIPAFNFTDINGKVYTPENTKGKVVLFKCWFIRCVSCVQEMPALNRIVEKYKDRKDVLFISLAIDKKKDLQQFLSKTKFDYATVPLQEEYMTNKLNVFAYPTHYLIGKDGKLINVLHTADEVAEALDLQFQ